MKKILIALLTVAMCLGIAAGLTACNSKKQEKSEEILIAGFDSYDEVVKFHFKRSFGIMDLVTDEEYVTQGEKAAKITTIGSAMEGSEYKPYMIIYTDSPYINRQNFLDVKMFKLDVYNTHDVDKTFALSLNTQSEAIKGEGSPMNVVVKPGMNHVEIPLDRNFLSQLMALDNVVEILFTFPNQTTDDERTTLYFDNFRAVTTTESIDQNTKIREAHEIESADRSEYLSAWALTSPLFSPVRLEFNTDPQYISQGAGSFKWTCLDVNENGGRGTTTPGFQMTKSLLTDLSDYYSISFDIFNTQEKSYPLYTFSFLQIGTMEPGWNHFEFTIDEVASWRDTGVMAQPNFDPHTSHYKYDIEDFKNFNLFTVDPQEYLVFYFDNFMANPETLRAPQPFVVETSATVSLNESFAIPAAELPYGTADITWEVKNAADEVFASDSPATVSFTAPGVYTVEYTATNRYGTGKTTFEIRVAAPVFTENFYNKVVNSGNYTLERPAVTPADAQVSVTVRSRAFGLLYSDVSAGTDTVPASAAWRTETLGAADALTLENARNYEITYTVSAGGQENFYVQNLFVMDGYEFVKDSYPEAFTGEYNDVLKDSVPENLRVTGNALRLVGQDYVKTFLGDDDFYLSNNAEDFTFFMYNNGDKPIAVSFFQDGNRILYPGVWTKFDYGLELYLRGWQVLLENNRLTDLNLMFEGEKGQPVDIIIDGFMVKNGSNEGPIIQYDKAPANGTAGTEYSFAEVGIRANDGSEVTWKIYSSDGTEVGTDLMTFTPANGGTYRVVYSATNGWGTSTLEFAFVVASQTLPVIDLGDVPFVQVFTDTTFTVPGTDRINLSGGENLALTWEVFSYSVNGTITKIGDNPATITLTDTDAFKIVYSAKNSANEVTKETVWVLYSEAQRMFSDSYGDEILTEKSLTDFQTPTYALNTDKRYIMDGTKSIALTGGTVATGFRYTLNADVGNATFLTFYVYATGGDVSLNIANGSGIKYIKGGQWNKVAFPITFYEAWGTVVDKGLGSIPFHIGKYNGTLYFTGFGVAGGNADPTISAAENGSVQVGNDYILSANTTGLSKFENGLSGITYQIFKDDTSGDPVVSGTLEEGAVFTPSVKGTYIIVYTAKNAFGSVTAETSLSVIVDPASLPTIDLGDIPYNQYVGGTYTVPRPSVTSGELSWKVYKNGSAVPMDGQPTTLAMAGVTTYKIVYSATNDEGAVTETIWVVYRDDYSVLDGTDEFTTLANVAQTNDTCEENADARYVLSGEKSLKFGGGANFVWNPTLEMGQSGIPFFYIYVEGADVTISMASGGAKDLKGGQWNLVEYSLAFWNDWGAVKDNVLTNIRITVPIGYAGTIYLDGLGVHNAAGAKPGVTVTNEEAEANVGEAVALDAVATGLSNLSSSIFTYTIKKGDEIVVAKTAYMAGASWTPTAAGTYTVTFTAVNRYGSATGTMTIVAGIDPTLLPTIDLGDIPYNQYVKGTTLAVPRPAVSDGANLSYLIYKDGSATPEPGEITELIFSDTIYKIVYTAANEYGFATETIWLVQRNNMTIADGAADDETESKVAGIDGQPSWGNYSINSDSRYVLVGNNSLKLSTKDFPAGITVAGVTWNPGIEIGNGTNIMFYVYLDGPSGKLVINNGNCEVNLQGGQWNRVEYPVGHWTAWGSVKDNVFTGISLNLPYGYQGTVYIDCIGVYGSLKPTVQADLSAEINLGDPMTIAATAIGLSNLETSKLTYEVTKQGDAAVIVSGDVKADTVWTPTAAGTYIITYTAENRWGTSSTKTTVTVIVNSPALPTIDLGDIPYNQYVGGTYTVPQPTVTSGELSWKVYQNGSAVPMDGQPATLAMAGITTYKIVYSATNAEGAVTETIWVMHRDDYSVLDGTDEFTTLANVAQTNDTCEENVDARYVLSGEKSLKFGGGADFVWNPTLEMGQSGIPFFYIYVEGADVTISMASGGTKDLIGGQWNLVDYPLAFWNTWGAVQDNVLTNIRITVPADYAGTIYLDGVGVHNAAVQNPA